MTQIILRKWFTHCNSRVSKGGAGDDGVEACVLTAEEGNNLSAASGVAYIRLGAILTFLPAPNPAPKPVPGKSMVFAANSGLKLKPQTGRALAVFPRASRGSVPRR
jgi:hypothetical protein